LLAALPVVTQTTPARGRLAAFGVTHPDRLFDVRQVPLTLSGVDARYAIVEPAGNHGVQWDAAAADLDRQTTNGYPAHPSAVRRRLERLSDRQAELLAAIAVHDGAARTAELTVTLARAASTTYSRTRDGLITEGDIYTVSASSPLRGAPLFAQHLLTQLRARSRPGLRPAAPA
jgi:hypothetical protein